MGEGDEYPRFSRVDFMVQVCLPPLFYLALLSVMFMGEVPLISMKIAPGGQNPLFYLFLIVALTQGHLSQSTMMNHVTKQYYSPANNRLIITLFVIVFGIYCLDKILQGKINMPSVVYIMLGVTVVGQGHFIVNIVNEMATTLKIRVFKVKGQEEETFKVHPDAEPVVDDVPKN
mmetsp:Transcript_18530/g.28460  ORF Transcript_18530/g.28460 Transcript_18530/m.28460 type:complete len:174 (+) Transcript_18530:879-1400(+)|eukprot:CAMPEP_0170486376 /NCGR_PEP_ID=MMETSP0208-20121228/5414_1 /TAXON_ID=197538 /ORGANISM="Strombidium inclinatum, Strain S3" /LENGTH=173 /DNA_ID=CAMNT_0010760301 /DNA_START=818 /DNA_END=1339 /DNA_ORIENTATION=+